METWEWECFERVLNDRIYQITDPGILYHPVNRFAIKRNDKLELILDTFAPTNATTSRSEAVTGSVYKNSGSIEFESASKSKAIATGVLSRGRVIKHSIYPIESVLEERSSLNNLSIQFSDVQNGVYTIEWLENVDDSRFIWPNIMQETSTTKSERIYSDLNDDFIIEISRRNLGGTRRYLKAEVDGYIFYLGVTKMESRVHDIKSGYILYKGTPSEEIRKKIRNCISFTLGRPLIYLGYTTFNEKWELVSTYAVSPNIIDGKVFELHSMPPAPLGAEYDNIVDSSKFSKFICALYHGYDELNLGYLIWTYWYAVCAPSHMAPVHFGALHEYLQKSISEKGSRKLQKTLIESSDWKCLKQELLKVISSKSLDAKSLSIFKNKIEVLNQLPQSLVSEKFLSTLGIELSAIEISAWTHRNHAAHGREITENEAAALIRETRILKVLFHRILIKFLNAGNAYYDYYSYDFPIRGIDTPIPGLE